MGTVLSLDLRGAGDHGAAIAEAVAWFHEADRRFSPYRPDSETCRHGRGEIPEEDRSPELADIIRVCDSIGALSGGAFDEWRAGVFDPSAYVKGWSAERAAAILRRHGCTDWSINAGGDVLTSGAPLPGRPWRVGVQHPFERGALAAVVSGADLAVATSGTYERGGHIVHPATGEACDAAVSVTVVGRDLGHADACSTAAFALGIDGPGWIAAIPYCESMTIWADGRVTATGGFPTTVHGVSITTVRQTDPVGAA
ncbi:FAD:protein FMN transferase [uncultured Amnibacterium sp.]|uniref:FAD:protein FMN transferase n=1 Tax=uncultured Amnibacterium sp. TaxID=1631851 RepID=UPI0035CC16C8